MTAQETKLLNAFETTLSTTLGASGTTATLTAVTDAASNNIEAPCYLVIEPDSATNREYVLVSAINIGTKTITLGDGGSSYRFLKGSSATSGLSHASGATIRYVAMAQHFEDLNDRVDTIINEDGTAVNTSLFLDEDDMVSDSATKGVTQQSVKAYVDSQVTAQDLDFGGDTGTGQVDLDSQTFTIAGTTNEIETSATDQTLTIGLPSSITVNVTGDLTGNADTATALETARTIGGVSFDGTANIDLPGVNTAGNQDTTGTASGLSATLEVTSGGTGNTSFPDKAVVISQDSGTDTLSGVAMDGNGELLIGGTSGPAVANLTQGSNVTITNADGSITIAATDTNTEYTAGDGLDLTGTVFSTDLKTNGGLSIDTTELKLDLNDLSAASVSVANDSIAIIDADDNSSKKESIADLATAMADGTTITASNGVLTAAGGGGVSLGLVLALG